MNHVIDLRSDTVTHPTAAMREAMAQAEVGDDVYMEDPTVNRLQDMAAERLGFEAALFAASGTQANLIGLLSHCERGDEYIVGQDAHTYRFEGGGAAVLGSIQPQPVTHEPDGSLDLERVRHVIKADNIHYPRSRLFCLENTIGGKVLELDYLARARTLARDAGLSLHLDGARVFNAAVKLQVPVSTITAHFDSVAFCLSKGLGAPVGSMLCGSHELIQRARRWRKMTGGGMRQAGILASAGMHALEHHVQRLSEDHHNAATLARGLAELPGIELDLDRVHTNMVLARVDAARTPALIAHMAERHIKIRGDGSVRLVTHLDVSAADIERVLQAFREFLGG